MADDLVCVRVGRWKFLLVAVLVKRNFAEEKPGTEEKTDCEQIKKGKKAAAGLHNKRSKSQ